MGASDERRRRSLQLLARVHEKRRGVDELQGRAGSDDRRSCFCHAARVDARTLRIHPRARGAELAAARTVSPGHDRVAGQDRRDCRRRRHRHPDRTARPRLRHERHRRRPERHPGVEFFPHDRSARPAGRGAAARRRGFRCRAANPAERAHDRREAVRLDETGRLFHRRFEGKIVRQGSAGQSARLAKAGRRRARRDRSGTVAEGRRVVGLRQRRHHPRTSPRRRKRRTTADSASSPATSAASPAASR